MTPSLLAIALLSTGLLGVLAASTVAEQKRELDKLKADFTLLAGPKEKAKRNLCGVGE